MTAKLEQATLLNRKTGKLLAKISLAGEPIQTDGLISDSGSLQGFTILTSPRPLWDAWFNQKIVLLRTHRSQQLVRIATYPTAGENQGHLDYIPGTKQRYVGMDRSRRRVKPKPQTRRWLVMLQALLSV